MTGLEGTGRHVWPNHGGGTGDEGPVGWPGDPADGTGLGWPVDAA